MPLKHTYMQVQNTSTNCDFNLDNEQLSPLPKTKTPIQDENTDAEGKKSFVWQYFKTATIDGVLSNICQVNKTPGSVELCLAAPAVNKNKSTTSMLGHLGCKHQIYDEKMVTGAITNLLHKGDILKILTCDLLTASVARFFVTCNGRQVLCQQLPDLKSKISLTCNTWTSPSDVSVLGVTAHWIDNHFSLQSITLAAQILKGSHTGVSLAEHLIKVLDEFDIHKHIFCITTDNTSNNRTMGVHLAETIPLDNENCLLGCMAHVINLAAQAGIEAFSSAPPPQTGLPGDLANILHDQPPNVEVKTIISWISGLTSFLKHSPTKAKEFATLAAGMKLNCISVFCITHEVDEKYGLEPQLWLKLDQLCDFLAPLKDATRTITPEHSTTLGAAAPIYMMLIN
ncbi:hypothetical protein MJO28_002164 [Puccinia striiformis f. sp. tritici]|uniref:Uncharacterized protein n=1 Tax=Puccinia striiformis f. sp. tritici TaxID=168172 RepID=A0ACC0EXQ8_9BASI|nr:hypothetical protein MJO28_002164 [Puccinia striiformis f. sp. tritici]